MFVERGGTFEAFEAYTVEWTEHFSIELAIKDGRFHGIIHQLRNYIECYYRYFFLFVLNYYR